MRSKKRLLAAAAAMLVLLSALFIFKIRNEMRDFEVNHLAGKRLALGETLYRVEDEHYQFKYPPFSAFLYLPLSFLPLPAAKGVWYVIVITSIILILVISDRLINPWKVNPLLIGTAVFLILGKFFLREVQLGQINALLTVILLLMIKHLDDTEGRPSSRELGSGLLWGLATALKPYALIFLPYFILKNKWRSLASGTTFLASAFMLPSLFYGFSGNLKVHLEWQKTLSLSTPLLLDSQDNISIMAFFMKWTGDRNLALILSSALISVLGLLLFYLILKGKIMPRIAAWEGFLLLLLIPLISPLGWDYTLLSSAPAIMLLLKHIRDFPLFWRACLFVNMAVISLSLYDLLGKDLYAAFMSRSIPTMNFLVIMGYLFSLRMRNRC